MKNRQTKTTSKFELDDEDKSFITDVFFEKIVTKLLKMHARIGTINCDFAGKEYGNWNIQFKSRGSGFEIVDFEYDEDSFGFNLEP